MGEGPGSHQLEDIGCACTCGLGRERGRAGCPQREERVTPVLSTLQLGYFPDALSFRHVAPRAQNPTQDG